MRRSIPNFTKTSNPDLPSRALYAGMMSVINLNKPVRVYRNLNTSHYSVMQGGLVKCHMDYILLKNATFIVRGKGIAQVLETRPKNAHAFVQGEVMNPSDCIVTGDTWQEVEYRSDVNASFVTSKTKEEVTHANYCELVTDDLAPVLAYNVNCEI